MTTYHKGQRCYGTGYDMMTRIEQLEELLEAATDDAKEAEAYAEELEAKLAKAVGLLEAWVNVAAHCTIEEGVCCCGDNMDTHAEPMDCGHCPVDHGAYVASRLVDATNAALAELTGVKAWHPTTICSTASSRTDQRQKPTTHQRPRT